MAPAGCRVRAGLLTCLFSSGGSTFLDTANTWPYCGNRRHCKAQASCLSCVILQRCRAVACCGRFEPGDRPPAPRRTFRRLWEARFAAEWRRAFLMFSASARSHPSVWQRYAFMSLTSLLVRFKSWGGQTHCLTRLNVCSDRAHADM
jgi:hypothetical protein